MIILALDVGILGSDLGKRSVPHVENIRKNIRLADQRQLAMTGKGTEAAREPLAKLIVDAVEAVAEDGEVDIDNIKIEKKDGAVVEESSLVEGVIVDKERVHPGMPSEINGAKIALINTPNSTISFSSRN